LVAKQPLTFLKYLFLINGFVSSLARLKEKRMKRRAELMPDQESFLQQTGRGFQRVMCCSPKNKAMQSGMGSMEQNAAVPMLNRWCVFIFCYQGTITNRHTDYNLNQRGSQTRNAA
jgi:hypothetical protein